MATGLVIFDFSDTLKNSIDLKQKFSLEIVTYIYIYIERERERERERDR